MKFLNPMRFLNAFDKLRGKRKRFRSYLKMGGKWTRGIENWNLQNSSLGS